MPTFAFVLPFFAISLVAQSTSVSVRLVAKEVLLDRLRDIPQTNDARAESLTDAFRKAGCEGHVEKPPVKGSKQPNILCTLPGEVEDIVLVGAHFDKVARGQGILDNGSGATLLPALYTSLSGQKRHHTFVFAGFADEEIGLVGSQYFATHISKEERPKYRAMVNVDTVGLGRITAWEERSHPALIGWFIQIVNAFRIPQFTFVNIGAMANSDAASFIRIKVPVIDFHSIAKFEHMLMLHTEKDNFSGIQQDEYFGNYRLIANYLAYIDAQMRDSPDLNAVAKKMKAERKR